MPVINIDLQYLLPKLIEWRHNLHQYPELSMEEHNTSDFVASKLREFGVKVYRNIGKTGIVGELKNGSSSKSIALRADMDALPIVEGSNLPFKSLNEGKMHACGHDGHIAMLLGAAKYLSETKQFDGTVYFIFQPAEETGLGAKAMLDDGLFVKFQIDAIYSLHNASSKPECVAWIFPGVVKAAQDVFVKKIIGKGTHGAHPERGNNPIYPLGNIVNEISKLNYENSIISVTQVHAGSADNVIPNDSYIRGTIRSLNNETREKVLKEIQSIVEEICKTTNTQNEIMYSLIDPLTISTEKETENVLSAVKQVVDEDNIDTQAKPSMGSEDFGFYTEKKPGSYFQIGNGSNHGSNHSSSYEFNDNILPIGVKIWIQLVEDYLKKSNETLR